MIDWLIDELPSQKKRQPIESIYFDRYIYRLLKKKNPTWLLCFVTKKNYVNQFSLNIETMICSFVRYSLPISLYNLDLVFFLCLNQGRWTGNHPFSWICVCMGKIRFDLMISRDDHSYFRNVFFIFEGQNRIRNSKLDCGHPSFLPPHSLHRQQ